MAVFRINKTDNYTVMSNHHLKDKNLSLKGKGLLSVMLSLPKEWDYSIAGLCKILKESETAIKSALKDLKECGYLVITKKYANETKSHHIEYEYDIYETPNLENVCQGEEPEHLDSLYIETPGQLNTNDKILKNKIHNNNREVDNNQTIPEKHKEITELTIEELKQLKHLVLENRDTQTISYREIQKKFNLIDPVTYDTPTICSKLIKQTEDIIRRINSTERCTGFSEEIF
nr:MAG TPA: Dna polymerase B [Caudoviricetes sp.]